MVAHEVLPQGLASCPGAMMGTRGSGQHTSSAGSEPDIELPVLDSEPKSPETPPSRPSTSRSPHVAWAVPQVPDHLLRLSLNVVRTFKYHCIVEKGG